MGCGVVENRRTRHRQMAEVIRDSNIREAKEPRRDEELPWTGARWTEDSRMA